MNTLYLILATTAIVSIIIKRHTRNDGLFYKIAEFIADLSFITLCVLWVGGV